MAYIVGKWSKQQNRLFEEEIYYRIKEKYSYALPYKPRNLSTRFLWLKVTNFKTRHEDVQKSSNVSNMLNEVRFNVFYTNRKGNTPTGNFRYIYELDRIDN